MRREQKIDWVTLTLYFAVITLGWINLYFTPSENNSGVFNLKEDHGKQLLFIGISIILGGGIMILDTKFLELISYFIYGIGILVLVAVLFVARTKGAASWFEVGGFKIQPTEFAKLATVMALAKYMSRYNFSLKRRSDVVFSIGIVAVPALLVLFQNDPGSFLTFAAFAIVFYREGVNPLLLIIVIITVIFSTLAILMLKVPGYKIILSLVEFLLAGGSWWFLFRRRFLVPHLISLLFFIGVVFTINSLIKPHHTRRIRVLVASQQELRSDTLMKNKEYFNLRTSLVAIGAGGVWGKGFGNATHTKGNHVPEEHTDYIFCVWSEEHGFIGDLLLMILLFFLMLRVQRMAENSKSDYARVFGYGLYAFLFFHIMINVGMTIGLLPSVGIPLPFFSYGGSSMLSFSMMIFILINHYSYRVNILK